MNCVNCFFVGYLAGLLLVLVITLFEIWRDGRRAAEGAQGSAPDEWPDHIGGVR